MPRTGRTAGTRRQMGSRGWKTRCKGPSWHGGKTTCGKRRPDTDRTQVGKDREPPPRKAAIVLTGPVLQTDTGRKGEEPEAGGRSIVKELGKIAP